jgi:hypothetical protein
MPTSYSRPAELAAAAVVSEPLGYGLLLRFVSGPRAARRIALLALLLALPAAGLGLVADDFDLAAKTALDPWGAYSFQARDPAQRHASLLAARAAAEQPWWIDERFHQAFMRPLASLTLALDFALWPGAVWWMHVENALLFAAIVLLAGALYRRVLRDQLAAGLATFFYATQPGFAIAVGWLSARNTLLAAAFGLLSIWLHQRAAQRAWGLRLAAAAAFACSLLSAELGLSTLAYLVAWSAACERGSWSVRLARLAPYLVIALLWRVVYQWAGFGVIGSTYYCDPVSDPAGFAWNLLTGIPVYLASQLTVPFASLSVFSLEAQLLLGGFSLVVLVWLRPLLWRCLHEHASARFLALGALLAIIPLGTTLAQDRLAFFVAFGTGGLLARCIREQLGSLDPGAPRKRAAWLFRMHALWLPLAFVPLLFVQNGLAAGGGAVVLDRVVPRAAAQSVVLINAPSALPVHFQSVMRAYETGRAGPPVDLLYAGTEPVFVRRLGAHALELSVASGFLHSPVAGATRDVRQRPFFVGDTLELPRMRVQVLEVRNGDPIRVRFDLSAAAPEPLIYAWEGREPRVWRLPEQGARVELKRLSLL